MCDNAHMAGRRRGHADPVTPELFGQLMTRDRGCVAPRIGIPTPCGSQFGPGRIELEVDHVDSAGHGKRGPSKLWNLVVLCGLHHRVKTESARTWRELLHAYLAAAEPTWPERQAWIGGGGA